MKIMTTTFPETVVRSHVKPARLPRIMLLLAGICSVMFFSPGTARALFHLWKVNEIYSSADGNVQFIELLQSPGSDFEYQLQSSRASVLVSSPLATNQFFFTSDLPVNTANKTLIIGTANLSSIPGGLTPDYVITNNFIPPGSTNVTYVPPGNPNDSVSYTNLPTNGDASLVRSGANMVLSPTNSPKNFNGESNSIVPVKIKSISESVNNFILSFATATGTNGTAGPNYAVQYNNSLTSTNWTTLTNVPGVGAITNVTDVSPPDLQRFYRLRVP
jgi:hypothetical protein